MARSKGSLATIIIVALVLVLLYALNPTTTDFQAWRAAQARSQAGGSDKDPIGVMKKGFGAAAGAMTSLFAGAYSRKDYLVFSTYSAGGKKGDLYLGAVRLFVKLR